jgi:hypothetical protein
MDLYFLTENITGLIEKRVIDVGYTDVNDMDGCDPTEEDCMDKVYYFILGE